MATTLSVLSVFIGIAMMVVLCYTKFSTIPSTILAAVVVGLLSSIDPVTTLGTYASGAATSVSGYFLLTAFGGMFGLVMERSGAASKIVGSVMKLVGEKATIYALLLLFALLTCYAGLGIGGIFMLMPLLLQALQRLDLPRYTLAGLLYSAMGGYVICYPGSVGSINLVPTNYIGTTASAGGILNWFLLPLGIIFTFGWFEYRFRRARKKGEHFVPLKEDLEALSRGENSNAMPLWLACLPIVVMFITLNIIKWNMYYCFTIAIVLAFALFWKYIPGNKQEVLNEGFGRASAIFNIMAAVGLGTVIKSTVGFTTIQEFAGTVSSGNPYWDLWVSGNILTLALASGSGSVAIMSSSLAPEAIAAGCNASAVHRIITIISQGFDTLPHCGTVPLTLGIAHLSYKEGYLDMFITSLVIPVILSFIGTIIAVIAYPVI